VCSTLTRNALWTCTGLNLVDERVVSAKARDEVKAFELKAGPDEDAKCQEQDGDHWRDAGLHVHDTIGLEQLARSERWPKTKAAEGVPDRSAGFDQHGRGDDQASREGGPIATTTATSPLARGTFIGPAKQEFDLGDDGTDQEDGGGPGVPGQVRVQPAQDP